MAETIPRKAAKTKPLGERLIEAGLITRDQLELALKEQARTGLLLGEILHNLGFVAEDVLAAHLADQSGVRHVDLKNHLIDPEALKMIPEAVARRHRLIPLHVDKENRRITVAMANTFDVVAVDEVQKLTNCFVDVVAATESDIVSAIDRYYSMGTTLEEALEESVKRAEAGELVETVDQGGGAPIVKLVDQLFIQAVKEGATDLHIEPDRNTVRTRLRIDGVLHQGISLPKSLQAAVATRIKIMAGMNISETRLPQDGRIRFSLGRKNIDMRVATFPTIYGENIVLRVLDREKLVMGLDKLGMDGPDLERFKKYINMPNGIVLVTGPTGSGKTTTLYSALSYINSLDRNIITIEDPVEYELPVIRQSQINPKAGLTYAVGLRSMLRQDPDVLLVGEMRDEETCEISIRAALTGHLVFSTMHTNDAAGAVPRLLDMGIEPFLVSSSLLAIVAQRLVRTICPRCKEEYRPQKEMLEQLGILHEADLIKFYRGRGCDYCNKTGYKGRIGIFEILPVTKRVRELINERADSVKLLEAGKAAGMKTLKEDGVIKVKKGLTTVEEVIRVAVIEVE